MLAKHTPPEGKATAPAHTWEEPLLRGDWEGGIVRGAVRGKKEAHYGCIPHDGTGARGEQDGKITKRAVKGKGFPWMVPQNTPGPCYEVPQAHTLSQRHVADTWDALYTATDNDTCPCLSP